MKRLLLLLSFGLLGLVLVVASSHAANTIKVGIVDTYSGPPASYSQDVVDGFKMARDKINAKGGVLGRKIEYTTRDEKFKPDVGLAMAKELVMKENVDILAGTINSATALAISDFVKKEKIPFFVSNAKSERITGQMGHRYVFSTNENTAMAGKAAAVVLAKMPFTKYWIAGDDYEFGHAIGDGVWNNLKALKPSVQLLGQTWWKVGETDFTPYITAIVAAKPDFIIVATGGSGMVNFQKAAKATGLAEKIPFYQHTANEITIGQALGMDAPEGVYGTANYLFYYPATPANKAFAAEFKKLYGRYPKMTALYGYITAEFIARGFQKAGSMNKEKFIDAVEGMVLDDTPVGKIEMRKCDHQVTLPMFWGVTKKSPEYKDFLISSDLVTIPASEYMPTCEQVLKARGK
ncbi:MAG TPA: ABC transporter substrate-binding protein [Syntrophorhabdales bacterium]|nr:ABC transporter substrate-binding protein [Syntrophorhabdales bacterium]